LLELEKSLLDFAVQHKVIETVVEEDEGTVVPVVTEGFGEVESPGGSVVCTLPVRICESMNMGKVLNSTEFIRMASAARADVDRFVASKLFDCFSGPWDSILMSLLNDRVVHDIVKGGLARDVYLMVDKMRGRFSLELVSVLANSNIFKKRYYRVFTKVPSMDDLMRAIRRGKFDEIAQTDGFIERVKDLKEMIDKVLLAAERQRIYLPTYITNAQRNIPLRGGQILGYVGEGVQPMPNGISKRLLKSAEGSQVSFASGKADF